MSKIGKVVAAAMASVVVSAATAKDAVQWRVEDGGNGHWYNAIPHQAYWSAARTHAEGLGGNLASTSTAEENALVHELVTAASLWCGAYGLGMGGHKPDLESRIWTDGVDRSYEGWYGGGDGQDSEDDPGAIHLQWTLFDGGRAGMIIATPDAGVIGMAIPAT